MHYGHADFVATLAAHIKQLRKERALSVTNMVQLYGYHASHWQKIEAGERMSLPTLLRVANTFDLTLAELLGGIGRQDGPGYGSKGFTPPPGSDLGEGE